MWIFLLAALLAADESPELARARQQLEIVRQQATAGLVPANAVVQAEDAVEDAEDQATLDRTLYAKVGVEGLTTDQADEMIAAADRRAARTRQKLERIQKLVDAGVAERSRLNDLEADLAARSKALDEAKARASLVLEIVAMARAESELPVNTGNKAAEQKTEEHFEGDHPLDEADIRELTLAFEKRFREPLPVSARGETAVHRTLGFDHTGRIDVALSPDSPEGAWLRSYLESHAIPFYAFRAAVPGKATAAHIHIGPPSTRLHLTD